MALGRIGFIFWIARPLGDRRPSSTAGLADLKIKRRSSHGMLSRENDSTSMMSASAINKEGRRHFDLMTEASFKLEPLAL